MAKKKGVPHKISKKDSNEKKKDSTKRLPKSSSKKDSSAKAKSKGRSGRKSTAIRGVKPGEVQKKGILKGRSTLKGVKKKEEKRRIKGNKKKYPKSTLKGVNKIQYPKSRLRRIRDPKGRFIEAHFEERLKRLRKELIRDGVFIDGKKITPFTSYATIIKAIYDNKLFVFAESHHVSYFDVLGKIVTEVNELKEGQEIFVKVTPFFRELRVFNVKNQKVDTIKTPEGIVKRRSYYSQGVILNPQMVLIIEHQKDLIQRVIDEFPRKITSPLFKIKERRYENPLTGATYALEYDYNDILPSEMTKEEFFDFLKAIMGDEYRQIAILRMKANLDKFSEEE